MGPSATTTSRPSPRSSTHSTGGATGPDIGGMAVPGPNQSGSPQPMRTVPPSNTSTASPFAASRCTKAVSQFAESEDRRGPGDLSLHGVEPQLEFVDQEIGVDEPGGLGPGDDRLLAEGHEGVVFMERPDGRLVS